MEMDRKLRNKLNLACETILDRLGKPKIRDSDRQVLTGNIFLLKEILEKLN